MNWIWELIFCSLNWHHWIVTPDGVEVLLNVMEDLNVHPFILYFCLHPKIKETLAIYLIYVIEVSRNVNFLFSWFDKEWQFKSLFEHDTMIESTQNDKFHLCKWPSKINTWTNSKRKCGQGWKVKSDNIILVLSNSSQEISIKISQQKPPSLSLSLQYVRS